MKKSLILVVLCAMCAGPVLRAAGENTPTNSVDPYAGETKEQNDARMAWWREARFGMFIHWGVYAVPAGMWKGQKVPTSAGEWIMLYGAIPCAEYQALAKQFNPVRYDADEWVRLAKEAGMKYIIITAKHHDGFALFDSQASDWNVAKATPYGKDLLQPLAEACRKHGLKLGFYYSQSLDWNNGGAVSRRAKWDPAQSRCSMDEYIDKVAVPQVKELLTRYGEFPSVLWWDIPKLMTPQGAEKLLPLLKLKPGIIHNNRLCRGFGGDTETPEQKIPATGFKDRDWETCQTMNDTWGFLSYDQNWKSTQTLLRQLIEVASKGGNYLLNVGPTAEGLIPQPSVERLKAMGVWMKVNSEAVYGTSASPFKALAWGRCTQKPGKLYLHVFDWPTDGKLVVPMRNAIKKAFLMGKPGEPLKVEATGNGQAIILPAITPDPNATVVVAEIDGAVQTIEQGSVVRQSSDGIVTLSAKEAEIIDSGKYGIRLAEAGGQVAIAHWMRKDDVKWQVEITKPGTFNVEVTQACEVAAAGTRYVVLAGGSKVEGAVAATGNWDDYKTVQLGRLKLDKAGTINLTITPLDDPRVGVMNLRSVVLRPVQ